jgi:hypothetical protein
VPGLDVAALGAKRPAARSFAAKTRRLSLQSIRLRGDTASVILWCLFADGSRCALVYVAYHDLGGECRAEGGIKDAADLSRCHLAAGGSTPFREVEPTVRASNFGGGQLAGTRVF